MNNFVFEEIGLPGAYLIKQKYARDDRGDFTKFVETDSFEEAGISFSMSEAFVSTSKKNVIRGLHFQLNNPQAKLVTVLSGAVWDVIVDLRPDSKTYGKWESFELTEEKNQSVFVPRGFAHGFVSMADKTMMLYMCDGEYDHTTDSGIILDDEDIGIDWPIDVAKAVRSERDMAFPTFQEYKTFPMQFS